MVIFKEINYENSASFFNEASNVGFCVGGFFVLVGLISSREGYLREEELNKDEEKAEEKYRFLANLLSVRENNVLKERYGLNGRLNVFR